MEYFFLMVYGKEKISCLVELLERESVILARIASANRKQFPQLLDQGRTNSERLAKLFSDFNPYFTSGVGGQMLMRFFDMFAFQSIGEPGAEQEQFRLSFQIAKEFASGICEQLGL